MPSDSQKQHNFMEAAAHDPKFAKKHHIDQRTAEEFVHADMTHPKVCCNGHRKNDHG